MVGDNEYGLGAGYGAVEHDDETMAPRNINDNKPPAAASWEVNKKNYGLVVVALTLVALVATMMMRTRSAGEELSQVSWTTASAAARTNSFSSTKGEFDLSHFSSMTVTGASGACPYAKLGMVKQQQDSQTPPPPPPPPLPTDNADLDKLLGPLASLVGTWVGDGGLSVVSLPKRESHPDDAGEFEFVVRPYKEIIKIAPLGDPVRNRGGFIEQYSGVVTYYKEGAQEGSITIMQYIALSFLRSFTSCCVSIICYHAFIFLNAAVVATDDEPGAIHVENGMLFYLSDIREYGTWEAAKDYPSPYPIARSATVPHGNVAFLFGSAKISDEGPNIHDINSRAINSGDKKGGHYDDKYEETPYEWATNPNGMLQTAIAGQNIIKTTHIKLDSKNQGSVTNTPFINANVNTTGFKADFWIEQVLEEDGSITEQLQYSEFVDILFHKQQRKHPGHELISWPHVNVNTLTKVKE